MKQHRLSAAFPRMTEDDFLRLVDDIRENGQQTPIVIFEGAVIDGWHRYQACQKLGIECAQEPYLGFDPRSYVKSQNLHRRHMSESQRAVAVAEVNAWSPAGNPNQRQEQPGTGACLTNAQMADEAKVSERTIKNAKTAITGGLGEKVKSGEIAAKPAADLVRKDPELAREVAEGRAPMPKPEKRSFLPSEESRLARMETQIHELQRISEEQYAELITLRAASFDEGLRNEARDELQGYRDALEEQKRQTMEANQLKEQALFTIAEQRRTINNMEARIKRLTARPSV